MITQDDIIYFIMTDRFNDGDLSNNSDVRKEHPKGYHGGDFKGIEHKFSYLHELGITAIWITPVYLSIGRHYDDDGYHGYWALDFKKVDPHLYTYSSSINDSKEYLRDFVKKCHESGFKVILDMVVNHTGYHNQKFLNYTENNYPTGWYNMNGSGDIKKPLDGLPDFNHDLADVRDFFVNNIIDWIEISEIDGIRMDTVKHVEDSFWHTFKTYIRGYFKSVTLIGEVLDNNASNVSRYQTLMDFDSLFDFPLRNTIKATLIEEGPLTWLARPRINNNEAKGILDIDTTYYNNANRLIIFLDNHDLESRIKTTILNHVGHWDRELTMKILKLCLAFLFTMRGIPQLYYGTEIGLEGDKDPYNRRDFQWNYLDNNLATLENNDEALEATEILEFTKKVIDIRKKNNALKFGYLFTLYVDHFIYAYMREYRGNLIIVIINNGRQPMLSPLTIDVVSNSNIPSRIKEYCINKYFLNLLDSSDSIQFNNGILQTILNGKEVKILKLQD